MRYDDVYEGQKVLVWDWREEYDDPPDHWNEVMEDYVGAIVTIAFVDKDGYVKIEEDNGNHLWAPDDFDPYQTLSHDDPNIRFKYHQQQKRYEKAKVDRKRPAFL